MEFNQCLSTTIDIDYLTQKMNTLFGSTIETKISIDPGRYVCNYVYCNSLQRFNNNSVGNNHGDDNDCCCTSSLFLHVPPFSVISEEKQLEYVVDLLDAIVASITTTTKQ